MIELFASAGMFLLLDQWSKRMVQLHAPDRCISWGPVLRIQCVTNLKDAYRRGVSRALLVLVWFAALFGLGLAFGGAAGNLLDILRRRYIVDFIDLKWWPVFNLADVAIVAGLVMALWRD